MRALEIGPGEKPQMADLLPALQEVEGQELECHYLDAVDRDLENFTRHTLEYPNGGLPYEDEFFDLVFASHILEHIPYHFEQNAIIDWVRVLKPGGYLHIVVPSWEYVARYVLQEKPDVKIKPYAFGGLTTAFDAHLNMFTLPMLRSLMYNNGLDIVMSRTGGLHVLSFGEEMQVEQHYVAGKKR